MDENEAVAEQQLATPIFNVYRRGYDRSRSTDTWRTSSGDLTTRLDAPLSRSAASLQPSDNSGAASSRGRV